MILSSAARLQCPTHSHEKSPFQAGIKWPILFTVKSGAVQCGPRMMSDVVQKAAAALAPSGLILRGGFNFTDDDLRPSGLSGAPAQGVLLVGNGGADYWPHFLKWWEGQPDDIENPLDSWSRHVISTAAAAINARVVMPNDKPFMPFQQWAKRAEELKPSPLGMLMHPRFGLWHAWRGALLLDAEISIQAADNPIHLCDLCVGKPCLNSCPASVFDGGGYDYQGCVSHVCSPSGETCRRDGCIARNACPQAREWRYPAQVQAFHQRAFAGIK